MEYIKIKNISRQSIQIILRPSNILTTIPSSGIVVLAPGRNMDIESERIDTAQLEVYEGRRMVALERYSTTDGTSEAELPLLYEHMIESVNALLTDHSGTDPALSMPVYSSENHAALPDGVYVRNEDCFINSLRGLTSMSPWNTGSGGRRACTLISPRHAVSCSHSAPSLGTVLRFVTRDNVVHKRTIIDRIGVPGAQINGDTIVLYLSSDLPADIEYVPVFPFIGAEYLPFTYLIPVVVMHGGTTTDVHSYRSAAIQDCFDFERIYENGGVYSYIEKNREPVDPLRNAFYDPIEDGDSGEPVFCVVNGELVLISHAWGYNYGPAYHAAIAAINSAMETLSTSHGAQIYTLREIDISGFMKRPELDYYGWAYQNAPISTQNRHKVVLTVDVPSGRGDYSVNVTQVADPVWSEEIGDATIQATDDPLIWDIIGSRHGVGAYGDVTLKIDVTGDLNFSYEKTIEVRRLGDINYDKSVTAVDKLLANKWINGLPMPPYPPMNLKNVDINGDGIASSPDTDIIDLVLGGDPVP